MYMYECMYVYLRVILGFCTSVMSMTKDNYVSFLFSCSHLISSDLFNYDMKYSQAMIINYFLLVSSQDTLFLFLAYCNVNLQGWAK